jgi:hypothetical protein
VLINIGGTKNCHTEIPEARKAVYSLCFARKKKLCTDAKKITKTKLSCTINGSLVRVIANKLSIEIICEECLISSIESMDIITKNIVNNIIKKDFRNCLLK